MQGRRSNFKIGVEAFVRAFPKSLLGGGARDFLSPQFLQGSHRLECIWFRGSDTRVPRAAIDHRMRPIGKWFSPAALCNFCLFLTMIVL